MYDGRMYGFQVDATQDNLWSMEAVPGQMDFSSNLEL